MDILRLLSPLVRDTHTEAQHYYWNRTTKQIYADPLCSPLNPNTTDARPPPQPAKPSSEASMSKGTTAGIAIGVAVFVLALAALGWLYISLKRQQRPNIESQTDKSLPPCPISSPKELKGAQSFATELDASEGREPRQSSPKELDGRSTHRKSWFSQPRRTHVVELHSMFSIQASVRRLDSRDTNGS